MVVENQMTAVVDSAEEGSAGSVTLTMHRCISRLAVSDGLPMIPRNRC